MIEELLRITQLAGREILNVYNTDFSVDSKRDDSPITEADRRAHQVIVTSLQELDPSIPVLSEEAEIPSFETRSKWTEYWLIDPLDGTRDFVERLDEFTVNIALVRDSEPVLGLVGAPTFSTVYVGDVGDGQSLKYFSNGQERICTEKFSIDQATLVESRHHTGRQNELIVQHLESIGMSVQHKAVGSSLKMCLIAEGRADLYVRFGPTSEWDTAAAQAVLNAAGGSLCNLNGESKLYNQQESVLNDSFYACGGSPDFWAQQIQTALKSGE